MAWSLETVGKMVLVLLVLVILSYITVTQLSAGNERLASCSLNGGVCTPMNECTTSQIDFTRDANDNLVSTCDLDDGTQGVCCSRI